ncbi:PHP domain-containing protein [Longispora sp. NPDC051575]|uniref:PHP domain-containing protein n=1 Tax=Longispora sp. NPDC051575 TaxID=3154943 RepID=UPI00343800C1
MASAAKPDRTNHHGPASFWAVDLHVHTPASRDVQVQRYGASTPEEVVQAAIDAGLHAIAITDHNTADWCDRVALAAAGRGLVVLPGMEISTNQGHVLGIWEEGTPSSQLADVLIDLGVRRIDHGDLNVCTAGGILHAARIISSHGGIAIAAHVDREKGLLKIPVSAHRSETLLDLALAAVEIVDLDTQGKIQRSLKKGRDLACVRGSDVTLPGQSSHILAGIGNRRTWIKASRPDLQGLRHAFEDPSLRVRLEQPSDSPQMFIHTVTVTGGFLHGQTFEFSSDLNCLVGGTGAGKSLAIELIRFALNQQADVSAFAQVRRDVDSRLKYALGDNATVELSIRRGAATYTVRRVYSGNSSPAAEVVGADGASDLEDGLIPIRAFSQGEVIEYARAPVGRMALVDDALDLVELTSAETTLIGELADNAAEVIRLRSANKAIEEGLKVLPEITSKLDELATFFDTDMIKAQQKWAREKTRFSNLGNTNDLKTTPVKTVVGSFSHPVDNESNKDLYTRASSAYEALRSQAATANGLFETAYDVARDELAAISVEWKNRSAQFDRQFLADLQKIDTDGKGLPALRKRLGELQATKAKLDDDVERQLTQVVPTLTRLLDVRDRLLGELVIIRRKRSALRERRIKDLNKLTANVVRMKLEKEVDDEAYKNRLTELAKGSHLRTDFLHTLCGASSPLRMVGSYLESDPAGVSKATGVDIKHVEKLFDWISDHNLETAFLALQAIDLPDALSIEFRKDRSREYVPIERLAHGQKCTAILILAMADGGQPLIIDQPEDALHAPWIEEHLVDKLRELRGGRQYIFATRSPGLVVSADAEMIITLNSDATHGHIEASGSLERHDLNALTLYHLEGGPAPFKRRTTKLAGSVN